MVNATLTVVSVHGLLLGLHVLATLVTVTAGVPLTWPLSRQVHSQLTRVFSVPVANLINVVYYATGF